MRKLAMLAALLLCIGASAQTRWAVVNLSAAFLRCAPDYEAALETQALMGSLVEIKGEQGYWRQVRLVDPPYLAWTTELAICEMSEAELKSYEAAPKWICTAEVTAIYTEASSSSLKLSELVLGDIVQRDDYSRRTSSGFVKAILPDGRSGYVRSGDVQDLDRWKSSRKATQANLVSTALRFTGVPYMWGGNTIKNVDCSGLVWNVYYLNGIHLPRNASQMAKLGTNVALDCLQPGDLVFFGKPAEDDKPERVTHVAMYIGDGNIIHASHLVRINSLDPKGQNPYLRTPLRACRIIAD